MKEVTAGELEAFIHKLQDFNIIPAIEEGSCIQRFCSGSLIVAQVVIYFDKDKKKVVKRYEITERKLKEPDNV